MFLFSCCFSPQSGESGPVVQQLCIWGRKAPVEGTRKSPGLGRAIRSVGGPCLQRQFDSAGARDACAGLVGWGLTKELAALKMAEANL